MVEAWPHKLARHDESAYGLSLSPRTTRGAITDARRDYDLSLLRSLNT